MSCLSLSVFFFFFFNDTATTEIYTLSLHDALPISTGKLPNSDFAWASSGEPLAGAIDRKSTRLNSSHGYISYAVFCLKKKKRNPSNLRTHPSTRKIRNHKRSSNGATTTRRNTDAAH